MANKYNTKEAIASSTLTALPLINVEMAEIITKEETPRRFTFVTGTEVDTEQIIAEGEEVNLVVKGVTYASEKADDVVIGTNITFKDNLFYPELLAVLEGGECTGEGDNLSYSSPKAGEKVNKIPFDLNIYSKIGSVDGLGKGFIKATYPNCVGGNVKTPIKDGEFTAPEYPITSKPSEGQPSRTIARVASLPAK